MSVVREAQEHSFLLLGPGPGDSPSRQDSHNSLSQPPLLSHPIAPPPFYLKKKKCKSDTVAMLKASVFPLHLEEKPVSLAGPVDMHYLPNLTSLLSL